MRMIPASVALAAAAVLAGCGGGGSETGTPKRYDFTPYAGNWAVCNYNSPTSSYRHQVTITEAGPGHFHYEWLDTDHDNTDCSGPGTLNYLETGDSTARDETLAVDGVEAQKVNVVSVHDGETATEVQLVSLSPQGLRFGGLDDKGQGYFMEAVFTPQPRLAVPPAPAP